MFQIALDFAVPFLSIPLGMKRESGNNGNHQTLVNIDPKALSIGSFLIAMISFVVPLLTGESPLGQYHNHYREYFYIHKSAQKPMSNVLKVPNEIPIGRKWEIYSTT